MRKFVTIFVVALSVSTTSVARTDDEVVSSGCFRLGLVLGTAGSGVDGVYGRVHSKLSDVHVLGAAAAGEYYRGGSFGWEFGASWLHLDYNEDYTISSGDYVDGGTFSKRGHLLNLYVSPLFHPKTPKGEGRLLVGPLVGIGLSGADGFGSGLTYGAQAVFDFGSQHNRFRFTAGFQAVVVPADDEFEGESIPFFMVRVGVRIN